MKPIFTGLNSPMGTVYDEVNQTIELISYKAIVFSVASMFVGHIIPSILLSYFKYFVMNDGDSSFQLPIEEA